MILSNTCKYGIRAVLYLALYADEEKKIGIKKISKELSIPTPFLGKILQLLARKKILNSTKGPNGGFGLGKEPDKISLLDIVMIIDGEDVFDICMVNTNDCKNKNIRKAPCPVHDELKVIRDQIISLFRRETVESIVTCIRKSKEIKI